MGFTVVGAVQATTEANYILAGFRALLFVGGSVAVRRAGVPGFSSSGGGGDGPLLALLNAADGAAATMGPGKGPVYGTQGHTAFANIIRSWGPSTYTTEVTYFQGRVERYGYPGGVRIDVVEGDVSAPRALCDLKTGSAELTPARIAEIQQHVPGGNSVPVIEIKPGQQ